MSQVIENLQVEVFESKDQAFTSVRRKECQIGLFTEKSSEETFFITRIESPQCLSDYVRSKLVFSRPRKIKCSAGPFYVYRMKLDWGNEEALFRFKL